MSKLINIILLVVIIPLTHYSHLFLNEIYREKGVKVEEKFNLPSPEITKVASVGYDNLLADLLWLQLIQYYGNTTDSSVILPELYSLANNIITLDPKFIDAYIFAGYALVDNAEFDKAAEILERGVKNNPGEWYLSYQLGFMYYINKKNKLVAARYLDKAAAASKDSPAFLKKLAATLYSDAGSDLDIKIQLWQSVYDKAKEAGDQVNLEKAYRNLVELKIEKDLETLRQAVSKYKQQAKQAESGPTVFPDPAASPVPGVQQTPAPATGASPLPPLREIRTLVDTGFLDKLPRDPFNRPYIYNENTGEVESFPLPWQK